MLSDADRGQVDRVGHPVIGEQVTQRPGQVVLHEGQLRRRIAGEELAINAEDRLDVLVEVELREEIPP